MTLLDELKRLKKRRANGGKKKAKKKAKRKKRAPKRVRSLSGAASKTRVAKLRAAGYKVSRVRLPDGTTVVLRSKKPVKKVQSFGAMMRQGGKRKLNVAKTRTRIKNLYKQGELAQANKLRAKLKAAGHEYKA
jgi:hypothetical protein